MHSIQIFSAVNLFRPKSIVYSGRLECILIRICRPFKTLVIRIHLASKIHEWECTIISRTRQNCYSELLDTHQGIDMTELHCQVTRSPITRAMSSTNFKFRPGDPLYLLRCVMLSSIVWRRCCISTWYRAMAVLYYKLCNYLRDLEIESFVKRTKM